MKYDFQSTYRYIRCLIVLAILLIGVSSVKAQMLPPGTIGEDPSLKYIYDYNDDDYGYDVFGQIKLVVSTGSGHAYLVFTGTSANSYMEIGAYQITSSSNSLVPGSWLPLTDSASNWFPSSSSTSGDLSQFHCCCVNWGYGMAIVNSNIGGTTAANYGITLTTYTLSGTTYPAYYLGTIYNYSTGTPDLQFKYCNYATMDSLSAGSWVHNMSLDFYAGANVPVDSTAVVYVP